MNFARAAGCLLALALVVGGGVARAQQDSLEAQKRRELEALSQQAKEKRAQAGALKGQVVVTFLAILEMTRLKMVRLTQAEVESPIYITKAGADLKVQAEALRDRPEEYKE